MAASTISFLLIISILVVIVSAACPSTGGSISFTGACTISNIKAQGCDLIAAGFDNAVVEAACDAAAFPFGASTNKHYQHDKAYMDGGSSFNDDRTIKVTVDAGRVIRFRDDVVDNARVLWPQYEALQQYVPAGQKPYMSNFNLTSSCGLRAAMCCFTETRKTALVDNTDVCYHDIGASRRSSHVYNGFAVFNSSAPTHCVAFAWAKDVNSASHQYKGNALFDVAFGTFLDKGYIKNIHGAPLCGCVEQMPTVTKAGCRKVAVTNEGYVLKIVDAKLIITQVTGSVLSSSCGDFSTHYKGVSTAAEQAMMKKHITGASACSIKDALNERFYVPGSTNQFVKPDPKVWEHVAGEGQAFKPTKTFDKVERNKLFMAAFNKSPKKIVLRQCHNCRKSHRFIYYRRLTPVPATLNLFDLFHDNFFTDANSKNVPGVDFKLFSSYEDALALKNNWTYCDKRGSDLVGFPRDCSPTDYVSCQATSLSRMSSCSNEEDYSAVSYGFYIQKAV